MICDAESNGKTVWVHSDKGMCIARFCKLSAEILTEKGLSALPLRDSGTNKSDWDMFCKILKDYYEFGISQKHKPKYITE